MNQMRELDIAECWATGMSPQEAVEFSIANSDEHFTERDEEGELMAVWGWRRDSLLSGSATLWMLSFGDWTGKGTYAARRSLWLVNDLMERFSLLRAYVHAKHEPAVRWLGWLDFHVTSAVTSSCGELFYIMERTQWAS